MGLVGQLAESKDVGVVAVDTFEQNHRISKNWPRVQVPDTQVSLSMAFSYPFVEPPELLPEFDEDFFTEFMVSKS